MPALLAPAPTGDPAATPVRAGDEPREAWEPLDESETDLLFSAIATLLGLPPAEAHLAADLLGLSL